MFSFPSNHSIICDQGIKWNFAKFLVDGNGIPVERYLPTTSPLSIEGDIVKLLESTAPEAVLTETSASTTDAENKLSAEGNGSSDL
jgi:hypothetical protein